MLEYTGEDPTAPPTMVDVAHTTYYGRNRIIAVMAVPPTIDGLNTPGSCTRFGQITGNSSNIGAEAKLRRGALVGIQAEVQSGFIVSSTVLTLEAELSAEIEVSSSIGTGLSMTKTITYYACNKEDRVVFSTTPYDRYIYTVASHPDPDLVGKEFTVDIPQPAEVLSWSKTYYNEHNGDQLDIGPEILQHTPGDISTYPTRTQKDYILSQALPAPLIDDGLWWLQFKSIDLYESDPVINVSQGSSTYIEEDSELRNTIFGSSGITSNVDFMAKACAFSVCGGLTSGFSVGAYAENTMTEGVTFRSTVWGLPAGAYETYKYKYGLFSYMQTLNDDETNITHEFIVLNYWVE